MTFLEINIKKEHKILIIIGIIYLAFLLLFISKFNFNPSATIELSENHLMQYDGKIPSGVVIHKTDGFDGQYYYMMVLNPSLEKIHIAPNFLQRILYPALAKILSLNITALLPIVFILINLASVLISSYVLLVLLKKYNANLNLVYLWAFNVGFLISITRNLTEPLMMCFIALMIYFFEKENHYWAASCLALALLTRELAITVYAAMLLYFLIKKDFRKLALYSFSIVPFLIWETVLMYKIGAIALISSSYAITRLPFGILNNFFNLFPNISHYIIKNPEFSSNYLRGINSIFSPLPILLFTIVQAIISATSALKEKKITVHSILLLSQIALIGLLQKNLFFQEIDCVGRYALVLFFFSILYFAKRGEKYSKILTVLLILSSALYFIQRFILPKGDFWIS